MMDEKTDQSAPTVLEFNTVELPPSIEIKESSIRAGEAGAFAKELIAKDTRFGPYKGEIINAGVKKYIDYRFAWEVLEKRSHILRHTVCAMDTKLSNWMRHVNCARFYEEQNILSVQDGFSIFYVAMKDIKPGEELLTWFDPKLLKRTKRRLSKMVRRPVGYTIELVPWSDEKKFVPEIIETKRARKKKVLSDMISLDENPMAITRTLQSLPKVPCTPRQLAQSATYRHLFASLIEKAESSPKPDSRRSASRDKSGRKQKIDPVVIHSQHNKLKTKTDKGGNQRSDSSSAWKDVKNIVSASCMNKMANANKTEILTNTHTTDEKVLKRGRPPLEGNSTICPKPRKPRRRTKNNGILAMNELTSLKPIVFKCNDDGSMSVEDHDESFLLKDMEFRAECDEHCPCLDKQEATKSHDLGRRDKESFVIYFTLLPEHKTLSPNNKVMYKCDICGSAYNHAYSLKRHYLGIHINHRYLTPSDIQSCQIKTFHIDTQLQMCSPKYPTPIAADKDRNEADIKNVSVSAINDNTETCELKTLSVIPSLAQLAKTVMEKISTKSNAPIVTTELDKKRLVQTSLVSNAETLDKTGQDRHELIMNSEEAQSTVVVQASEDVSDLNSGELGSHSKTEMSDTSKMCQQADKMCATLEDRDLSCVESSPSLPEGCTANKMSHTHVITESSKTSHLTEGHSVGLIDKVPSTTCTVAKVDDDSEQITVAGKVREASSNAETQDYASEVDAVSLSSCSDNHSTVNSDENTKLFSETSLPHNVLCNSDLQPSNFLDTSTEMSSLLESVCEHNSLSSTDNVTSQVLTNSEDINKPNCATPERENLHYSLKELDIANAENTASERSVETLLSVSELIDSDSVCNVQPSKTSVLSSTSDSKILSLPAILSSDIPLSVNPLQSLTFSANSQTVASSGGNSSTPLAINEPVSCSDVNSTASLALSGSAACTETINLTPISSVAESVVTSSSTLISSLASSTSVSSTAVAVSAKNSSPLTPQVIFVTNIVFPIVTTSHKALTTSAQSSTSSAQAVTTACLAKTLTKGNKSTGVPLVLISPITGGISGANAFLQSSTALKTIQTLQSSLNARSLSKAPTMITGTKGSAPTMCTGFSTVAGNLESCISRATVAVHVKSPVQPPVTSSTLPLSPSVTPVIGQENGSDQPEDLYRCHMCVLLFKTMGQLKNHIKNDPHRFKGGIKQYACSHCSVRFSNKANLLRHNLIRHSLINHQEDGNHKHICYTCGKGFSTETYLNMHARFHSGKNFPCKYGCEDLVFPNAATLVKHLRTQHAGLDLKEYLKNVKPRDRKKRIRVKKTSNPVGVVQVTGITSEYQSPAPYSMMQPGIGFQAKRAKLKPSRETVASEIKTEPFTDDEKSNDSKLEEMNCEENVAPETLLFKCKLCLKGFSTHLRLLQHRTLIHGASQSVQEYLYQMSKDIYEDEYSEQESNKLEYISPPSSPKTFFSNVNRKGYENMKHYIDGGLESLKNWRKYLKVEDYVSLAEHTLSTDATDSKIEWTYYNFPPTFVYKNDCTEFYNEDVQEIKSETGVDKPHLNDNSNAPEENRAVFPMDERKTDQATVIKTEAEDISYGAVSQERGHDIITRLEQRLLADQDNSDASDKKKPLENKDIDISVKIKTEVEDSSYDEISLNKTCKLSNTHEDCEILDSPTLSDKPSEFVVSDSIQDISMQVTSMNSVDGADKKDTLCRLDSGFSSLSSSESPSLDLYENDAKVLDTNTSEISSAGHDNDKLQNFLPDKSCIDISSVPGLHTSTPSKREFKRHILPDFPLQEKLEALESSHIQSINLEANHSHCIKSELSASRLIDALNLHITGSQLLSTKIMHILEKYRSSDLCPAKGNRRQRTLSLPSLGLVSSSRRVHHTFEAVMDGSLNISDSSRHDHKRYSIWTGQIHHKVLKEPGESTFCCPVVETVKKQESIRLREQYMYEKASRDREDDGKQIKKKSDQEKVEFARVMGLMQRKEFEISHHAKKLEEHIIKPPEIWKNYENIWFGKKGTIAVVCSICHRHFSYWDLCLRHQLKKHPHIEPASIEMERNNDVEDLYYYYPMRYGILAQTQLIPDNLPPLEVYVCTRCGFPFKNLNKLHSHIIDCDPAREASSKARILGKSSHMKKKLLPMMDRRLTQDPEPMPSRNRHGKNLKMSSNTRDRNKSSVLTLTASQVTKNMQRISCPPKQANVKNSPSFSSHNSVDAGSKQKSFDLLYNPQNHMRRRELYKVLDQHQCHGCNLKFNSLSMLERHVNKCIGREKLQSQKPLVSQIIPDDAAVRKQHTCRYCSKRFTFIKGVDLHYKRICAVRKVKEEENQLTEEDLAHEEELKRIIEHMKWSKALNKDSSDIIQGHVRVEEDGTLTRVVKERSCPKSARNKKALNLSIQIQNEEDMSLSSSASSSSQNLSSNNTQIVEDVKPSEKPCRRLTRSTSLEKVSPVSTSGKRKLASPNSDMSIKKKTRSNSSSRARNDNRRKSECNDNRSRKQNATPRSRNASVNKVPRSSQHGKLQKANSESSLSRASVNESVRLPARKRGRPQKFDPSDLESSYKKKKKLEMCQKQTKAEMSKTDCPKTKSNIAVKTKAEMTSNKKTANAEASNRNQRQSSSTPSNKTLMRELTSAESSKMMEKMKQLKEAAKLESDNETKLKRAKQAKKVTAKKCVDQDLLLNSDSPLKKSPGRTQSSELFKQLTKSETKVPLVKPSLPNPSPKMSDKKMLTSNSSNVSTLTYSKRKNSEIPQGASPSKKINTTVHSSSPKNLNSNSPSPSQSASTTCKTGLKSSPAAASKIITLAKTKVPEANPPAVVDKISPKSVPVKISTLPTKLTTAVSGSSVESATVPTSKAQPVCVRVVTLSPNGMNLLTFDSPADVPTKVVSPSTPVTKSPEVSTVKKIVKTSSLEALQLVCSASVSQPDTKALEGNKLLNTTISIPTPNIPSSSVNACIKIKKPLNQVVVKTAEEISVKNKNSASDHQLSAANSVSQKDGQSHFVISPMESSPVTSTIYTVAKPQGYSVLKTAPVVHNLSTEGVKTIVTAPGSKLAGHQIVLNNPRQKFVKLTSPVQKVKLLGNSDIKVSEVMKQGQVSKVGDTVRLISSSKLLSPTNVVPPSGSEAKHIVLGSTSTILVSPSPTKSSLSSSTAPGIAIGTKLRTPASRFASPQPSVIHGNVFTPGTRVLKIGSTVTSTALQLPSADLVSAPRIKGTAPTKIISTIPEKHVLTVSVPKTSGSGTQLRLPQAIPSAPKQIIKLNTNNFASRSQPTVIVQSSPSAQSIHRQSQGTSLLKTLTPTTVTSVRTSQTSVPNPKKVVATGISAPKQPTVISQPSSLLSNQIMISLDDGTTAMLDPDSLAQLLSMSPTLNTETDLESEILSTIETDPEHIMVNMAEIQPAHQQQTDDINWPANGCVDLTDFSNSICDL